MISLFQMMVPSNVGAWILGAFLTGIATLVAYELSKKEWITLMVALVSSLACVFLGFVPAWMVAVVVIGVIIYIAFEREHGKW